MNRSICAAALAFNLGVVTVGGWAANPDAKEPAELERLRQDYQQRRAVALRPVNAAYEAQLEALQKKLTLSNDLEGALAVRKELDAIKVTAAEDGGADLQRALLASKWSWIGRPGEKPVEMTFEDNGNVGHIGMHGTWQLTGPREVTISIINGPKVVLRFDDALKSYSQVGGTIRGRSLK